jgi:hypothetical protein
MATTLTDGSRNAACDAIVDRLDAGAAAGKIRLKSAGAVVIAEVTLADPAFGASGAAVVGRASLAGAPRAGAGVAAAGAGTDATTADFCDSDNNVVFSVAVGEGAGELQLDNTNIANGQVVNITGYDFNVPAS